MTQSSFVWFYVPVQNFYPFHVNLLNPFKFQFFLFCLLFCLLQLFLRAFVHSFVFVDGFWQSLHLFFITIRVNLSRQSLILRRLGFSDRQAELWTEILVWLPLSRVSEGFLPFPALTVLQKLFVWFILFLNIFKRRINLFLKGKWLRTGTFF